MHLSLCLHKSSYCSYYHIISNNTFFLPQNVAFAFMLEMSLYILMFTIKSSTCAPEAHYSSQGTFLCSTKALSLHTEVLQNDGTIAAQIHTLQMAWSLSGEKPHTWKEFHLGKIPQRIKFGVSLGLNKPRNETYSSLKCLSPHNSLGIHIPHLTQIFVRRKSMKAEKL